MRISYTPTMQTFLVSVPKKRAFFLGTIAFCILIGTYYVQPHFLTLAREYVALLRETRALVSEKRKLLGEYTDSSLSFTDASRRSRITFRSGIVPDAHSAQYDHGMGVAAADVNNDSTVDIFFVAQTGNNELWLNRGDAVFTKQQASDITMPHGVKVGAAFADLDNDGDPDLLSEETYTEFIDEFKKGSQIGV
jgi:hypothetical protein